MDKRTVILLVLLALLITGGGVAVYTMTRGLRNNNPGNIKISGNAWQGKVPVEKNTDGTFEQFDTMQHGIRALSHLLNTYFSEGFQTVAAIISRFSETDQAPYIQNVSDDLSVDPNALLDVSDPSTKFMLVRAIIKQEQGFLPAQTISDTVVSQGVAS